MSVLSKPYFHDEAEAFRFVEGVIWPQGPTCPHCGAADRITAIKPNPEKRVRMGLKKCGHCKKQFTVRVGTIFEESKLPMTKWLQAIFLMCASKKGVSAHQLHRTLEVTYKTAWFLAHRIREAMRSGELTPFGQSGATVEADETYIGRVDNPSTMRTDGTPFLRGVGRGPVNKRVIVSVVQRGGAVRSFHVKRADKPTVTAIVRANLAKEAKLYTDESRLYADAKTHVVEHQSVNHSRKEYARGEVHTNTVEGYFSIFKRGMRGVYQHCGEKHLHRYLAEFDFRYSNRAALGVDDESRTVLALEGAVGKRLTYRTTHNRPETRA